MPNLREQYRDQLLNALTTAVTALRKAEDAAAVWADEISAGVEEEKNLGPSDPKRFDDPLYARNLRLVSTIREAREAAERIKVP